jgi:hypothetical protein
VTAVHGIQTPVGDIVDGTEVILVMMQKVTMDEVEMIDLAPV